MLTEKQASELYKLQYDKVYDARMWLKSFLQGKISQSEIADIDAELYMVNIAVSELPKQRYVKYKKTRSNDRVKLKQE